MRIQEVESATGMDRATIRFYEREGPQPFSNLLGNSEPLKRRPPERRQLQTGRTSCVCSTLLVLHLTAITSPVVLRKHVSERLSD